MKIIASTPDNLEQKRIRFAIGTDVGGTHVTCAAVEVPTGRLLENTLARATYDHAAPAETILQNWAAALKRTLAAVGSSGQVAGIGFAMPGPFEYRNGVSRMERKFKNLYGVHIPSALAPLLDLKNDLPMRFLNDATAFAVGEAWAGEGKDFRKVVAITLGTGFGSAFAEDGIPVVAGPTVPKEGCLWHLPFKNSIADDYISTGWFVGEYQKRRGQTLSGVKELMEKAPTEALARDLFSEFGQNLAACLAGPLRNFGAEVLVIGGNISHALPLFGAVFEENLKKEGVSVKIAPSKLRESAALLGSARLLDEGFWEKVSERLPNI